MTQLTVVTVTYNDHARLVSTCESLKAQAGVDFEHLVIDGGSTDDTVRWYASNPPVAKSRLVSEPDDGIFDAMNKGLRLAEGEYIVFLNAGDLLAHDRALANGLVNLDRHQASWGYSRARVIAKDGATVRPPVGMIPYSWRRHLLGFATICHQAVTMRTDFLRGLSGFDYERFGYASDYHLLLRAAAASAPCVSDAIDVAYEAGGISEVDIYRQLWRRHRARVDVTDARTLMATADSAWTVGQTIFVGARRSLKLVLRLVGVRTFLGRRTARTGP
jgi:GT2 family glycosyltransferase